jgi:hypothetical protein
MTRKIVPVTSPNEDKPICIFEMIANQNKCYSQDRKYFTLSKESMTMFRKMPRSAPYIFIKKNVRDNDLKHLSLRKQCKFITKEADKLKKLTDGKINLFRTGSVAKTSLQLFYDTCNPPEPETIEPYEVDILEECRGALIWGNKYIGKAYKYDICSEYPSLMASAQHKYPTGKGDLKTFTKQEFDELKFYQFGLYHVKVHNINYKVFKKNHKNWYTHSDLNFAKNKLNLKIELIEDDEPNALLYDSSKLISGNKLFGPFVDYLFKLKKDHKECKKYLNALWGALTQTNILTVNSDTIYAGKEIMSITPDENGNLSFDTYIKSKFYENNYARIKPFMMSYGRLKIANIILTNLDSVIRVHTDGIICTKPITNVKLDNNLGDLKYEGSANCNIINANTYYWEDETFITLKRCLFDKCSYDETYKKLKNL